jgi:N6-adenosine-specific RNA methylase IME4
MQAPANDNEPNKYAVLYADPPWRYGKPQHGGKGKSNTGGAASHFPVVTVKTMMTWDIASICEADCQMFMWSSSPHLPQAIKLAEAWGFQHWTTVQFVWHKQRTNPGSHTLSSVELCLGFSRGLIPKPRGARNVRQFYSELRGKHSAKPHEFRKRIELMYPTQRKIELFARERFPGWDAWGNEVHSDVSIGPLAANDNHPVQVAA